MTESAPSSDPGGPPRPIGWAPLLLLAVIVALVVLLAWGLSVALRPSAAPGPAAPGPGAGAGERVEPPVAPARDYLFCFWNAENLFDDRDDPTLRDDREDWFGLHPEMFRRKVEHLANALLRLNAGRGPDIVALVEVENRRAVEGLRDALNARLPPEWRYTGLVHRELRTGRRIEPAVLTRLAVRPARGRDASDAIADWLGLAGARDRRRDPFDFGERRILMARLEADGYPLTLLVSHWTSRVTADSQPKRVAYAQALYAAVMALWREDPAADVLLAGDFNDEPGDRSVAVALNTTPGVAPRRPGGRAAGPELTNLMARLDARRSPTYVYRGRGQIFDQIIVSPGLLDDRGWRVLPQSLRVESSGPVQRNGRPVPFGGPNQLGERGYSDHFAVTVRLRVGPGR
jgi:endonuclease/exonuclease/phosphatase family metal-dependent hydrolase